MEIKVDCNDNFFTFPNDNNNFSQQSQFQNVLTSSFYELHTSNRYQTIGYVP